MKSTISSALMYSLLEISFFFFFILFDGYFTCEELLQQVDKAIDIFKGKTQGYAVGLFLFDNIPSY